MNMKHDKGTTILVTLKRNSRANFKFTTLLISNTHPNKFTT